MRAFPFATTISVLIGFGGLGAGQFLNGPQWAWLGPYMMWGGFGCAFLLLIFSALLHFLYSPVVSERIPGDVASGKRSAVVDRDNNGLIVTGTMNVHAPMTVPVPAATASPQKLIFNWNMQQAYLYRAEMLGRSPDDKDVSDIFRDFRQEARDGNLIVRGIPLGVGSQIFGIDPPHEKIPPTHWREMEFHVAAYALDADSKIVHNAKTELSGFPTNRTPGPFYGLMVSQQQIEALWPRN